MSVNLFSGSHGAWQTPDVAFERVKEVKEEKKEVEKEEKGKR